MLTGCVFHFFKRSKVRLLSILLAQKKSEPCKGGIHFFRYLNPLPRAQNFNPKFEFQTLLAQNSPVGTLEFLLLALTWIFLGIGDSRRFL